MKFRPFATDDYNAFSGAIDILHGSPPLICDDFEGMEDTTIVLAGDPDCLNPIMCEVFFEVPGEGTISYFTFFGSVDEAKGYLLATHDMYRLRPNTLNDQPKKWMRGH